MMLVGPGDAIESGAFDMSTSTSPRSVSRNR
jgi:hypothetical protein